MGLFSGIKEARTSQGGVYLKPGVYKAKVIACKSGKTRAGAGFFVVELDLLESSNPELPAGTVCSWMVTLDKEPALGNIKHFLSVVTGTPEADIDEAAVEMVVSADNPLEGDLVGISATNIKTKKGSDFTKVVFKTVEAEAAA